MSRIWRLKLWNLSGTVFSPIFLDFLLHLFCLLKWLMGGPRIHLQVSKHPMLVSRPVHLTLHFLFEKYNLYFERSIYVYHAFCILIALNSSLSHLPSSHVYQSTNLLFTTVCIDFCLLVIFRNICVLVFETTCWFLIGTLLTQLKAVTVQLPDSTSLLPVLWKEITTNSHLKRDNCKCLPKYLYLYP